jgi:hypothetical protein
MTLGEVLGATFLSLLAVECCGLLDRAARVIVGWAVQLKYGDSPRGHERIVELLGDLENCPGQLSKFCYALALLGGGVADWLRRKSGRADGPGQQSLAPGRFYGAAMALSAALRGFDGDIRAERPVRRKEFRRLVKRLHGLLGQPPRAFGDDGTAALVAAVETVGEVLIDDRDERTALRLAEATDRHLAALGHCHEAALGMRRTRAHALLELGCVQQAETELRVLLQDQTRVFGATDSRTLRTQHLLYWTVSAAGRPHEAEAGLRAVEARLASLPGADRALMRHIQCKRWWTVGSQRRTREAAAGYDDLITDRSRELGPHHPDTLDARHSKGKMLVIDAGDGHGAYAVLKPVLRDIRRVEGRDHPNALETRKYLALSRILMHPHRVRTHRGTVRELRRVLRKQLRRHGPGHPNPRDTQGWITLLTERSERR